MKTIPVESRSRRPQSLREVSVFAGPGTFDAYVREFMDEYDKQTDEERRYAMLTEEPEPMSHPVSKAYLAAISEYLSRLSGKRPPLWTQQPECFLDRPHFGSPLQSHKAMLLVGSPAAFRRRLIFVGDTPLQRPHRSNRIESKQTTVRVSP